MSVITFEPGGKRANIQTGDTVLQAALKARIPLAHKCGGKGSCTTCKVSIKEQQNVSKPSTTERKLLSPKQINNGIRLACQTKVYATTNAEYPEDPLKAIIRKQLEQQQKG